MGAVDTCVRCGAQLDVGRFCVNCGHRIGEPVPAVGTDAAGQPTEVVPRSEGEPGAHPDDDLIPYDDVAWDGAIDSPVQGKAWLAWVLGAVLLVGLVFVLLQIFGVDGDNIDDSTSDARADEAPATAPRSVGKILDAARGASFEVPSTAPPTTDLDGQLVDYGAEQMHDGIPATAWRMAGDGTGSAISITLAEPVVVSRVGLINGYAKKVSGVAWYPHNRRIVAATWAFEDGTTLEQTFDERPGLQRMKVPPVLTSTVTLTLTSVTAPGTSILGRDYTAISEVSINGRRAG